MSSKANGEERLGKIDKEDKNSLTTSQPLFKDLYDAITFL